jgi:hypothetical protein
MGMQEHEAKQYKEKMKGGNTLISVHYRGWNRAQTGEEIFKNAGAVTAAEEIVDRTYGKLSALAGRW